MWVLVGCAVLLVLGLCGATGLGMWMMVATTNDTAGPYAPDPYAPDPYAPDPYAPDPYAPNPQVPDPYGPAPLAPAEPPRVVTATVTSSTGSRPVPEGALCTFQVDKQPSADQPTGYWCRTRVECGGRVLYGGGPTNGYFPCTVYPEARGRDVVGADSATTSVDTDAAMSLDTQAGTLHVHDDAGGALGAYSVEARVTDVR